MAGEALHGFQQYFVLGIKLQAAGPDFAGFFLLPAFPEDFAVVRGDLGFWLGVESVFEQLQRARQIA